MEHLMTFKGVGAVPSTVYTFGDGKGTSITITGGIHGNEQTGVHAAMLLMEKIKDLPLHGTVKIIPVCNQTAFMMRERTAPFDKLDLNRIFPGDPNGSYSKRLADAIWNETADAEYIIDLHCCGLTGSIYTLSMYEEFPEQIEMGLALGMPVVCRASTASTPGQLYVETIKQRGQKTILIELPGGQPGGIIDLDAAELCANGLVNYLKYLGILEGEYKKNTDIVFGQKISRIATKKDGLFLPIAKPGDRVKVGDPIGTLNGKPILSKDDGVLTSVSASKYVFQGDNIYRSMHINYIL